MSKNTDEYFSSALESLLSKFDNGFELYQKNATFAICVESLLRGGDIHKILEQLIVIQENQTNVISKLIEKCNIPPHLVIKPEEKTNKLN